MWVNRDLLRTRPGGRAHGPRSAPAVPFYDSVEIGGWIGDSDGFTGTRKVLEEWNLATDFDLLVDQMKDMSSIEAFKFGQDIHNRLIRVGADFWDAVYFEFNIDPGLMAIAVSEEVLEDLFAYEPSNNLAQLRREVADGKRSPNYLKAVEMVALRWSHIAGRGTCILRNVRPYVGAVGTGSGASSGAGSGARAVVSGGYITGPPISWSSGAGSGSGIGT